MELIVEPLANGTLLIVPADALISRAAAEFRNQTEHLPSGGRVVADLSAVRFVDSSGCSALLQLHRRLRDSGGELRVCCVAPPVRALFEQLRLTRVLSLHATRADAVA